MPPAPFALFIFKVESHIFLLRLSWNTVLLLSTQLLYSWADRCTTPCPSFFVEVGFPWDFAWAGFKLLFSCEPSCLAMILVFVLCSTHTVYYIDFQKILNVSGFLG
jgi:hypothetical protein